MVHSTTKRPEIITHNNATKYEDQQNGHRWSLCYVI